MFFPFPRSQSVDTASDDATDDESISDPDNGQTASDHSSDENNGSDGDEQFD